MPIWQAFAEPKCKFFAWLVMHDKVLTADNMLKRNWECNYNCSLCLYLHETTQHLLTQCNFIEAAWNLVATGFNLHIYNDFPSDEGPREWVTALLASGSKKEKRKRIGMLCIFWWMIWKKGKEGFFDNKHLSRPPEAFVTVEFTWHCLALA
jgi:hypothetical protein